MTYLIRCVLTFSKETFFEARKARINLGRPEMEKRKEKKRRREEKILIINVTRRSRSLDRESWSCSRCCSDIYRFAGVTKPWRPNHVQGSGKSEVELIEITTGLLPLTIHLRSTARQSPYSTLLTLDPRFLVHNSVLDLATWSEKEKEEKEMSAWSFLSLSRRKREGEEYFYFRLFSKILLSIFPYLHFCQFFFPKKIRTIGDKINLTNNCRLTVLCPDWNIGMIHRL